MSAIQELIEAANHLCQTLDAAAANEKKFCQNVTDELERLSWNSLKISNDLKQIREYLGG
jgi:hypothetical protein